MSDFGMPPPPPPPFPSFPTTPPPPSGPSRTGPAWEQPGAPLQRFIDTAKAVLLDPTTTFATMRREGGLQVPLTYFLIGALVGALASFLWSAVTPTFGYGGGHMGGIGLLVVSLGCYLIGVFLASGIYHVVLGLFGGQNFPFETTFRVVAYSVGSTAPFALIPGCGGLIGGIWGLVCTIIGLAQAQETTTGKAAVAVLVPIVVCCGLTVFAMITFGVAAGVAGGLFGR